MLWWDGQMVLQRGPRACNNFIISSFTHIQKAELLLKMHLHKVWYACVCICVWDDLEQKYDLSCQIISNPIRTSVAVSHTRWREVKVTMMIFIWITCFICAHMALNYFQNPRLLFRGSIFIFFILFNHEWWLLSDPLTPFYSSMLHIFPQRVSQ